MNYIIIIIIDEILEYEQEISLMEKMNLNAA